MKLEKAVQIIERMCDPSTHGISQELRNEYLNQQIASEFDQNGCDVTILAVDGETIYR